MSRRSPNIILIVCDDLGYGDLSCYGSRLHETPYIDRMAEEGVKFTDFYMPSPVCSPSRGGMMTGCYPKRIGFSSFEDSPIPLPWHSEGNNRSHVLFPGQRVGLNPEETTIAKQLKKRGYATMLVGKWHCGDQKPFLPTNHGFDYYYGLPYSNDMGRQKGSPRVFPPLPLVENEEVIEQQPDQTSLTERYVEQSIRFMRNNRNRPFFLCLAHMYVHRPIYVQEQFLKESKNGRYGAAVRCIDWSVGVILYEIKRLGLDEDTLVIFTSDNGSLNEKSNYPLRGTKNTTWEGGVRVPCIMRWPGKIPAGKICREIATSMDFLPTLSLLAGIDMPKERIIDGKDIRELMFDPEKAKSPYDAFFYYSMDNIEAVRVGKWKLHLRKGEEEKRELYNLEEDISETNNLYDRYPEVVERLMQHVELCRKDLGDGAVGRQGVNCRPIGKVENPMPLTCYDPECPYIIAMYDLEERG